MCAGMDMAGMYRMAKNMNRITYTPGKGES